MKKQGFDWFYVLKQVSCREVVKYVLIYVKLCLLHVHLETQNRSVNRVRNTVS